jgi:hypothetical protein
MWRLCNPDISRFTWRESSIHGIIQSRLDYLICPHNFIYELKECKIGNSVYSDHNPIVLELYLTTEQKRGKGLWKFNNSLLSDTDYITKVKNKLDECIHRYKAMKDHCLKWDTIKAELRGLTISHATYASKKRRQQLEELTKELDKCEKTLAIKPDADIYQQMSTVKKEIEEINNYITKGIIIRAQANYVEQNETNSKLFLGLEKSRAKTKNLSKLILEDGSSIQDPAKILNEEKKFYEKLYNSNLKYQGNESIEARKYFLTEPPICVTDEDQKVLDLELTDEEIANALKELPTRKSPGGDGFPVDFYKFFWPDIKTLVCASIKHAAQRGEMSIEQKRVVLTLIPKKEKDIRLLKNWRPISLLNADYKILAKALATRMQRVIPYLVNYDQSGCIRTRSTLGNIRSIIDVINYTNENCSTGIITFVDFEKAFDTVSWEFLFDCLKTLKFGDKFIQHIKLLYNNVETCVTNNGYSSQFFKPTRGIRQGCPVSAMLFILVVEILANAIRKNPRIDGIKIGDKTWKIGQYADDTSLFLQNEQSLTLALTIIEMFSKCSGLKMNRDKSESLYIGISSNFRHKEKGIKWTNGPVKCLGAYICKDNQQTIEINIKQKLEKIENIIKIWACRHLTLKGKVTIVNSLLLSQMLYIASVIHIPDWAIQKYHKLITNFLWDKKPAKIKYETLIAPIPQGGLNLQDLETKIKANKITWIKKLLKTEMHTPWKSYLQTNFSYPIDEIPLHNTKYMSNVKLKDKFYIDTLKTWSKIKYLEPTSIQQIIDQVLWQNDHIQIDDKNVYYKTWENAGISKIHHIININGKIRSKENLENKYSLTIKQHEYNSLTHSLPKTWLKKIKGNTDLLALQTNNLCKIYIDNTPVILEEISTKEIYKYILEKEKIKPPTSQSRWIEKHDDIDVGDNFWQLIYETPFHLTKNSKVLMVQYKLVHRILAVNHNLKKWERIDNSECELCGKDDTLEHFIFECPTTNALWHNIHSWWKTEFQFSIPITLLEVIFGAPNEIIDKHINLLNYMILHAKYYIYVSKKQDKQICLYDFLLMLKKELKLKKTYYLENSRAQTFDKNWNELYSKI